MTKAFDSALRLLTRRDHGALELCDKLERKGFSTLEAKEALENCQRLGLQSDQRFIEQYTRYRTRQGYGPIKISQELKSKGIDVDLIHEIMNHDQEDWLQQAQAVWRKKSKGCQDLSFTEIQKQQRFLLYRGFSMDIISKVVRAL